MRLYILLGVSSFALTNIDASKRLTPEQMADQRHLRMRVEDSAKRETGRARAEMEIAQSKISHDILVRKVFLIRDLIVNQSAKADIESALTKFASEYREYPNEEKPFSKVIHTLIFAADHLEDIDVTKIEFEGDLLKSDGTPRFPDEVKLPTS
jgi:hypothetical protein